MSRRSLGASLGVVTVGLAVVCGILLRGGREPEKLPALALDGSSPEVAAALSEARARVVAQPQSAEAWGAFGMLLRAHDFEREANVCLAEAERLDRSNFRWPYLRAASLATSDAQEALEGFRRAAELRPELPFVRLRLAELLIDVRRLDEAEPHVLAALEVRPQDARAELAMARVLFLRGDPRSALEWAERSSRHAPGQRATHELLSQIHHRLGNSEVAAEQLRVLESLPEGPTNWEDPLVASVLQMRRDAEWLAARGQELIAAGRVREGLGAFAEAVARRPENSEYAAELGRAYEILGDHARAAEVLDRAIKSHPDSAEIRRLRGIVHYSEGEWERAANCFREAISRKPDHAAAYENLGFALLKAHDQKGAEEALRASIRLDPQRTDAHAKLSEVFLKDGRRAEALAHLRLALKLSPADPLLMRLLREAGASDVRPSLR